MAHSVCIIQARVGSTRLPRKVLLDIGGASMLERVVRRARRAEHLDEVVIATTTGAADDAIVEAAAALSAPCVRGPEDDVLERYLIAAREHEADIITRVTSDCPLIDPKVIDRIHEAFRRERPDYASNILDRSTYPRGLDAEVFLREALERAGREAHEPHERVHVTPYLYQHPELFRLLNVPGEIEAGEHRWTVDTEEDLRFVREAYALFGGDDGFAWTELLEKLASRPEISAINQDVRQKELREG